MVKKRYLYLDIFRVVLCLAVLLYHLELLKGGFLAVCCFFVLSGYLTTRSLRKRDTVHLKEYYLSRCKKLYLPLFFIVLMTIALVSLQQDVVWVSLKPETTSVLLGYNNIWQIDANLDYFARHTNSPFMHLWYISILMQFELVFPILFIGLQKTEKMTKHMPTILSGLLAIGFTVWFLICSRQVPIFVVYYNTFTRIFSLFIGVNACFLHDSLKIRKVSTSVYYSIFYGCMAILLVSFCLVRADSEWFAISMIISSLLSCLMIESAIAINRTKDCLMDRVCKPIADISYEIYLVQFPVIYLYQILAVHQGNVYLKALEVSLITFGMSALIHFVLTKTTNLKRLQIVLCAIFVAVGSFGGYQYIIAEDHTAEMKRLEEELAASAVEMEIQKAEYEERLKQEQDAWESLLEQLNPNEETIRESVLQLPVVFIGDSVMLGATSDLRDMFDNGYVDAKVSRTAWVIADILKSLTIKGPVVIHAGTNGDVPEYVKDKIMRYCGNQNVFWITVTNDKDVHVNSKLKKFVDKYDNAYVIDWKQCAKGHSQWFYSDGIHLQPAGRKAYTQFIYDAIFEVTVDDISRKREEAIEEHENQLQMKYSFFGNDLLLGLYESLHNEYIEANFVAQKYLNADGLLAQLHQAKEQETLNYNVVLVLDSSFEIDDSTFKNIKEICAGKEIYMVTTMPREELPGVHMISFQEVLEKHPEYFSPDRIHLTQQGNDAFFDCIVNSLNKEY